MRNVPMPDYATDREWVVCWELYPGTGMAYRVQTISGRAASRRAAPGPAMSL